MSWFKTVFGFKEEFTTVKENIKYNKEENRITSLVNNRSFDVGEFSTPSVASLRERVVKIEKKQEPSLKLKHVAISDIYKAHQMPEYKGALFQVASQFNCLEFTGPQVIPELGITGYYYDNTQGPSCCLATPAGTLFRNYFLTTPKGNEGQTEHDQVNNLDELEAAVNNNEHQFWVIKNGYSHSTNDSLSRFNDYLKRMDKEEGEQFYDSLISKIRIGLQSRTEVDDIHFKDAPKTNIVSQAFCSALSIGYSSCFSDLWMPLARIVLFGMYEATLLSSVLNSVEGGSNKVVLTFVGGGVFGNEMSWIEDAIARACARCAYYDLEVHIAHYRSVQASLQENIDRKYQIYLKSFYQDD